MTLLTFILSLALSFVCSTYEECQNIRTIEYYYEDFDAASTATSTDAASELAYIDYRIKEVITFVTDEGVEVRENVYDFPYLHDRYVHDWRMAVELLARERGIEIKEFNDNVAVGYLPEGVIAAYMDVYDNGIVTHMSSFDYLDERELQEQITRYIALFVSFSLFYKFAGMINSCFRLFHKDKGKGV